jgi:periplasmic divalent cation tolerance protein
VPGFDKPDFGKPDLVAAGHSGGPPVEAVLVYTTLPSMEVAETIGSALVGERLAACVNIVPGMVSIYHWQGRLNRDAEVVMIVKTVRRLADRVGSAIRERHPYTNPALLVIPVVGGARAFLDWIGAEASAERADTETADRPSDRSPAG